MAIRPPIRRRLLGPAVWRRAERGLRCPDRCYSRKCHPRLVHCPIVTNSQPVTFSVGVKSPWLCFFSTLKTPGGLRTLHFSGSLGLWSLLPVRSPKQGTTSSPPKHGVDVVCAHDWMQKVKKIFVRCLCA